MNIEDVAFCGTSESPQIAQGAARRLTVTAVDLQRRGSICGQVKRDTQRATIHAYDFKRRRFDHDLLGTVHKAIEVIGSTSVRGMGAQDIIKCENIVTPSRYNNVRALG